MDRLTRMLAGLLRCLAGLLGEHRRDWVHALLAETDDQPTPSARLAWLGGCGRASRALSRAAQSAARSPKQTLPRAPSRGQLCCGAQRGHLQRGHRVLKFPDMP